MLEKIESLTNEFLSKLKVKINNIEVKKEDKGIYFIKLDTDESSFII
jgi:hypothetical protein